MTFPDSIRDIRCFVAVYEERSFTAAATREHATQSGMSQHIRKLEDRAGVLLFRRGGSEVVPTPAAEVYYQHCIELLRRHDLASRTLRGFGHGLDGEVVAGLMPTMTRRVLAPTLARFMAEHPNVTVRCVEGYSAALTQKVRAGDLDFAVVPDFSGPVGLRRRLFARMPEVLVSAPSLASKPGAPLRLSSLGALKLIVPSHPNTRRHRIETYLATNGIGIGRLLELDSMFGTLDLVATSDWLAILPRVMMAPGGEGGRFSINPIDDPPLVLDLALIEPASRSLSPAAAAFVAMLQTETARLTAD